MPTFGGGIGGGHFTLYGAADLNSQNVGGNFSQIRVRQWIAYDGSSFGTIFSDGASWSMGGVAGGSGGFSYNMSPGSTLMLYDNTFNVGHDANGNFSSSLSGSVNMNNSPYATTGSYSSGFSLPRIALAPAISALTADTIKPSSARLGADVSNYGHGTSATFEMFYRLQGSGTWISLGQQGDVGGFNYWNVTGLQPGKTYEYICNCFNNNGDLAQTGIQTFKAQPVSGMISVMKGII